MLRSLNSGVTGLMNHQVRMDVIGNNISNVNTVGFKGRRVTFEESFNQLVKGASRTESKAGGTNPMQVGLGVSVGSIDVMTGQGNLQNTGRIFDLAIEGNAFFGVSDGNGTYYTRNGAFQLDSEGYIILPTNGFVLQGRMADSFGNFPPGTAIGNLQIPLSQQAPAKETTEVIIARNLDSEADAKGSVTYSQRMLHPADTFRASGTNSANDPGRDTTTLTSLYNSKGQSLNIKENDALTISWYDQASVTAGTPPFGELTVRVVSPDEQTDETTVQGAPISVSTIDGFAKAIEFAINHDSKGYPITYDDGAGNAVAEVHHTVTANNDGTFTIEYDPAMIAAGVVGGTTTQFPTSQIFNLQIKSSNPLSDSYVNKAFYFGAHIGPQIGNYKENMGAAAGGPAITSDALLRPAEQFDYMYNLKDANGNRLYPGLDSGDPIDVFGSVGKTSIQDGKSDPILFYPPNAVDTFIRPPQSAPQSVFVNDADSLKEINDYNKWVDEVNSWANSGRNKVGSATVPNVPLNATFEAKVDAYIAWAAWTNLATTTTVAGVTIAPPGQLGPPAGPTIGFPGTGSTPSNPLWGDILGVTNITYTFNPQTGAIDKMELSSDPSAANPHPFTGAYASVTLLDDLLAKIRNDFKLPANYIDRDGNHLQSVGMNPSGTDDGIPPGSIVIRGSKGKDFGINNLSIRAVNSNSDKVAPTFFNAAMGFTQKRAAEDVGVVPAVMSVYDESGAEHVLTITFVHTGRAGEWEWKATFAGKEDIVPGSGSGTVTFGQDGTVSSWIFDNGGSQLQVDPHNGSNMMYINLNVGGPGDFRGITQFASASTINIVGQDGYTTGNLIEVTIDEYGLIEGAFSNGTNRTIAQIMMIDFANPGGLLDMSDSIYTTSANSGDPVWGLPITQSSSKLKPGAVEMSNVDLSAEFTNMITTQRGYQANSRVITVSDTMLEELVNLKR